MKTYNMSSVRERLAEALDETERGVPVIIERHGVRFRLSVVGQARRKPRPSPAIEILDPAVAEGGWTWNWTAAGLKFRRTPRS